MDGQQQKHRVSGGAPARSVDYCGRGTHCVGITRFLVVTHTTTNTTQRKGREARSLANVFANTLRFDKDEVDSYGWAHHAAMFNSKKNGNRRAKYIITTNSHHHCSCRQAHA